MAQSERTAGIVTKLIAEKGFGFIAGTDGQEYFFHRSALSQTDWQTLQLQSHVTFTPTTGPKGTRAENVEMA